MNKDLKAKILNEIEQSGFPLELHVTEMLRERKFLAFPNLSFRHTDETIHEIDVFAVSGEEIEKGLQLGTIGTHLIVECKRSKEKPWVFFEEVWDPIGSMGHASKICVKSELKYQAGYEPLTGCMNSALASHHYNATLPSARTYFEAFKRDGKTEIFNGVSQVWYALAFWKRWFESTGSPNWVTNPRSVICQPLIVFDGELLLAKKRKSNFDVIDVNHVLLRTSDSLTSAPEPKQIVANEVVIDIVKFGYFREYLKICRKNLVGFCSHLATMKQAGVVSLPPPRGILV